ncbi:hypothetical protein [Ramlibacter sp.]|uniref:hypothetical protein n=1 Tax=Ramlibacter sp. TaxID=1917967 RepID=UPI003D0EB106
MTAPVMHLYWVEMYPLDASGNQVKLRFATRGVYAPHIVSFGTVAYDDYDVWMEGLVLNAGVIRRAIFGGNRAIGRTDMGAGSLQFQNRNGALDGWDDYNFDGQPVLVRYAPSSVITTADDVAFVGFMGRPDFDRGVVTVPVRDKLYGLDQPVQPLKYGGTNVAPNGLDGTPDDIAGQPIPVCQGIVFNETPVRVNAVREIYQVHDKLFQFSSTGTPWSLEVMDRRIPLSLGELRPLGDFQTAAYEHDVSVVDTVTDTLTLTVGYVSGNGVAVHVHSDTTMPGGLSDTQYYYARGVSTYVISLHPTSADAVANTNKVSISSTGSGAIQVGINRTPFGRYDVCNVGTGVYFRLGSKPAGAVTFNARNNAPSYLSPFGTSGVSLGYVAHEILSRIADAGVYTYNLPGDSDGGIFITQEITARELLAQLAGGVGAGTPAYGTATSANVDPRVDLVVPVDPATSTEVLTLTATELGENLQALPPQDEFEGAPIWRVNMGYAHNGTVMSKTDIPGASDADLAFCERAYRTVTRESAAIKTQYPKARELNLQSHLATSAGAADQADALLARLGVRRRFYAVDVPIQVTRGLPTPTSTLQLNDCVKLVDPRHGLAAGKKTIVFEMTPNHATNRVALMLWG